MATVTLSTTNQTALDKLDYLTQEYSGTLEERIKTYLKTKLLRDINDLIINQAKDAVNPSLIQDTEIS